ncbi:unnamed protein product [Ectocarpus fasciculatus]
MEQELSECTTPHKKRASSWATLQDLAAETAEETLDGMAAGGTRTAAGAGTNNNNNSDVDIRKTISSPALQQMLSHRGLSAAAFPPSPTSAAGVSAGGGFGVGLGAVPPHLVGGGLAALPSSNIQAAAAMPSGLGGVFSPGLGASISGDSAASTAAVAGGPVGGFPLGMTAPPSGEPAAGPGMVGANPPPDVNAFSSAAAAAAAAAGASMNPLQLASMNMIASMNMNLGVKMGLDLAARMGGGGAPGGALMQQPGMVGAVARGAGTEDMMST